MIKVHVQGPQKVNVKTDGTSIAVSENGATFIPNVSPEGIISWTNDKKLPNPEPRNIKGAPYEHSEEFERLSQQVKTDSSQSALNAKTASEAAVKAENAKAGIVEAEKNSKTYAESALNSKTGAETAKSEALAAKSGAEKAKQLAETAATSVTPLVESAKLAEANAKTSETNAKQSELKAEETRQQMLTELDSFLALTESEIDEILKGTTL